jgi:hypothetical protein
VAALAEELRNDKFPGTRNPLLAAQLDELAAAVETKAKKDEARRARLARQKIELEFSNIIWCADLRPAAPYCCGTLLTRRLARQGRGTHAARTAKRQLHGRGIRQAVCVGVAPRPRRARGA